ncbi:hypothetical protein [Sphingomonas adhaesiva]|uniref:hypothetical protein n=1 Tax=Sphingomonas adhaesiva TaxID=28212 RepID=UPI002FFAABC7
MTDSIIHVRPVADGFAVTVEPSVPGFDFNAIYPDYRSGWTFARGVKRYCGFQIVDETQEGGHG